MKMISAVLALGSLLAFAPAPASAQSVRDCGNQAEVDQLPALERNMVEQVLESKRKDTCRSDACEFHVDHLDDGRYLVKMRARRPSPYDASCITVWMSEEGFVFDATGRAVDIWPYCLVLAHDASLPKPAFKPDPLPYKYCEAGPTG